MWNTVHSLEHTWCDIWYDIHVCNIQYVIMLYDTVGCGKWYDMWYDILCNVIWYDTWYMLCYDSYWVQFALHISWATRWLILGCHGVQTYKYLLLHLFYITFSFSTYFVKIRSWFFMYILFVHVIVFYTLFIH